MTQKKREYWKYIFQVTLVHVAVLCLLTLMMGCQSPPKKMCVISEWATNGSGKLEKTIDRGNKPCEDYELVPVPEESNDK